MPSRNELIERLEALEQQLRDLRREVIGEDSDPNARDFRALRFLKAFYDEPGQRIL